MTPDTARLALQFLARVDLKGAEAPALMQVLTELQAHADAIGNHAPNGGDPDPLTVQRARETRQRDQGGTPP